MATVSEILKSSGFSDEQIAALDARAITAFTGVLTTAEQAKQQAQQDVAKAEADRKAAETSAAAAKAAKDAAELLGRSNTEFYETKIVPGLTDWEQEQKKLQTEKANAEARAVFYEEQIKGARAAGFLPADAPAFVLPSNQTVPPNGTRDAQGRFVANAPGSTPGSPTFTLEQIDERLGNGISNVGWAMQEYQRLTGGQYLPDSFDRLSAEATAQKLPFRDYVARKYDFAGKQAAIQLRVQQDHDAKVAADRDAVKDAEWKAKLDAREAEFAAKERLHAERAATGSPVAIPVSSRIPDLQRRVAANELPDPLLMNESQRRSNATKMIRDSISQKDSVAA